MNGFKVEMVRDLGQKQIRNRNYQKQIFEWSSVLFSINSVALLTIYKLNTSNRLNEIYNPRNRI